MAKQRDSYHVSLKLLLKNSNGEILILKSIENGSYAGYYDLPGGRIDTDEFEKDFSKIIAREVAEEIGNIKFEVNIKPVAMGRHLIPASIRKDGKDIHNFILFFEAQYIGGKLEISSEHTGYKWVDLNKIKLTDFFTSGILEGIRMYLNK